MAARQTATRLGSTRGWGHVPVGPCMLQHKHTQVSGTDTGACPTQSERVPPVDELLHHLHPGVELVQSQDVLLREETQTRTLPEVLKTKEGTSKMEETTAATVTMVTK